MYMSKSSAFDLPPATRAEIMKQAGDRAAAAPVGNTRGTKGAGRRG